MAQVLEELAVRLTQRTEALFRADEPYQVAAALGLGPSSHLGSLILDSGLVVRQHTDYLSFAHAFIQEVFLSRRIRRQYGLDVVPLLLDPSTTPFVAVAYPLTEGTLYEPLPLAAPPGVALVPIYARPGSLIVLFVVSGLTLTTYAACKFIEGLALRAGELAAEALFPEQQDPDDLLPEELLSELPPLFRGNGSLQRAYADALARELARQQAAELSRRQIVEAHVGAVVTAQVQAGGTVDATPLLSDIGIHRG